MDPSPNANSNPYGQREDYKQNEPIVYFIMRQDQERFWEFLSQEDICLIQKANTDKWSQEYQKFENFSNKLNDGNVIVFFNDVNNQLIYGYASVQIEPNDVSDLETIVRNRETKSLSPNFQQFVRIKWDRCSRVTFDQVQHIQNPQNGDKCINFSQKIHQLPYHVGRELQSVFDECEIQIDPRIAIIPNKGQTPEPNPPVYKPFIAPDPQPTDTMDMIKQFITDPYYQHQYGQDPMFKLGIVLPHMLGTIPPVNPYQYGAPVYSTAPMIDNNPYQYPNNIQPEHIPYPQIQSNRSSSSPLSTPRQQKQDKQQSHGTKQKQTGKSENHRHRSRDRSKDDRKKSNNKKTHQSGEGSGRGYSRSRSNERRHQNRHNDNKSSRSSSDDHQHKKHNKDSSQTHKDSQKSLHKDRSSKVRSKNSKSQERKNSRNRQQSPSEKKASKQKADSHQASSGTTVLSSGNNDKSGSRQQTANRQKDSISNDDRSPSLDSDIKENRHQKSDSIQLSDNELKSPIKKEKSSAGLNNATSISSMELQDGGDKSSSAQFSGGDKYNRPNNDKRTRSFEKAITQRAEEQRKLYLEDSSSIQEETSGSGSRSNNLKGGSQSSTTQQPMLNENNQQIITLMDDKKIKLHQKVQKIPITQRIKKNVQTNDF